MKFAREIIDIDTNYMEDESTGPSAKQKMQAKLKKMTHLMKPMMKSLTRH